MACNSSNRTQQGKACSCLSLKVASFGPITSSNVAWHAAGLFCRTLWLNWCDGMTVQDIFIISIWLTVNLSWFSAVVSRNIYQKLAKLHLTDNSTTSSPNSITTNQSHTVQLLQSVLQHRQQAERTVVIKTVYKCVARSLGTLLFPNLTLLFYPVARGSVVLQAFNIPYPAAIRCEQVC